MIRKMRKEMTRDNGRFSSLLDSWKQIGAYSAEIYIGIVTPYVVL